MSTTVAGRRTVWAFARHYLEMVVAMLLGMVTLYPLWALATGADDGGVLQRADVDMLAMATAMTVPMAWWMVRRGHRARPVVEMSLAMYAGFALLFPLLWAGAMDEMDVMMTGHVLMPLLMLGAMLARRREYAHAC